MKVFRKGATGALLDEYEKAILEYMQLLRQIPDARFTAIADAQTDDPDCRSIQTVAQHVVASGYGYANHLRRHFGHLAAEQIQLPQFLNPEMVCTALASMLQYTENTLQAIWNLSFEAVVSNRVTLWGGQVFDVEQLLEHAIVHVLRHRRQTEWFLQSLQSI
ncbi:hypothetical protein C7N43_30310 [Sphingobacteriales bacterium UPWRP_1]|nr:hypothetical protein BVG80_02135 [Sphingobacteriales bacterium TSM_CSM]PSJ73212.1 hypothetical protein C7N43_30310 [Sphingobacteriales bacterium UPWRP_1]